MGASRNFAKNGTTEKVVCGSASWDESTGAGTAMLWYYCEDLTPVVAAMQCLDTTTGAIHWFRMKSDGKMEQSLSGATEQSTAMSTNTWVHHAYSWDTPSAGTIQWYYNGVAGASGSSFSPSGETQAWVIGNNGLSGAQEAQGDLSWVTVWSAELTAAEINEVYYRPMARPNNLELQMPLWGESTERDLSGQGRNGTVTNATVSSRGPRVWL